MKDQQFPQVFSDNFLHHWDGITEAKKPIIAAVNGYAVSKICLMNFTSSITDANLQMRTNIKIL